MNTNSIHKLLKTTLLSKFPSIIKDVILNEEELGPNMYYIHCYIIVNNYDDLSYEKDIREYIREIEKYSFALDGNHINQISFSF